MVVFFAVHAAAAQFEVRDLPADRVSDERGDPHPGDALEAQPHAGGGRSLRTITRILVGHVDGSIRSVSSAARAPSRTWSTAA